MMIDYLNFIIYKDGGLYLTDPQSKYKSCIRVYTESEIPLLGIIELLSEIYGHGENISIEYNITNEITNETKHFVLIENFVEYIEKYVKVNC